MWRAQFWSGRARLLQMDVTQKWLLQMDIMHIAFRVLLARAPPQPHVEAYGRIVLFLVHLCSRKISHSRVEGT